MHRTRQTVLHCRSVCVLALVLAAMLSMIGVSVAQDNDNDADDGFYGMMFNVPAVPEAFGKSGTGGWGALVLTFSGPIEGATFVFNPACPTPLSGMIDPTSNNQTIQLGPGAYGLGPTGGTISRPANIGGNPNPYIGQQYGGFWVVVEYENDGSAPVPTVTGAFWQSKLTTGGNRTWTISGDGLATGDGPDMTESARPQTVAVPEPSTFLLFAGALVALVEVARRKRRV